MLCRMVGLRMCRYLGYSVLHRVVGVGRGERGGGWGGYMSSVEGNTCVFFFFGGGSYVLAE